MREHFTILSMVKWLGDFILQSKMADRRIDEGTFYHTEYGKMVGRFYLTVQDG